MVVTHHVVVEHTGHGGREAGSIHAVELAGQGVAANHDLTHQERIEEADHTYELGRQLGAQGKRTGALVFRKLMRARVFVEVLAQRTTSDATHDALEGDLEIGEPHVATLHLEHGADGSMQEHAQYAG